MSRLVLLSIGLLTLSACNFDWSKEQAEAELKPATADEATDAGQPGKDGADGRNGGRTPSTDAGPPDATMTEPVTNDAAMTDPEPPDVPVAPVKPQVTECVAGAEMACSDDAFGNPITGLRAEVGSCRFGKRTCSSDGRWGACNGAQGPRARQCDSASDNDCDGYADNDSSRRDATCECWGTESKACTGEGAGNCPGRISCSNHHWGTCVAPSECFCTDGASQACVGGPNQCPGGSQVCAKGTWQACAGAPAYCDCKDGDQRGCSGGPNNCAGGTQTCSGGQWGACTGAPTYCECATGATSACSALAGAGACGTATCSASRRWDRSGCTASNACGSCTTLLATPETPCDGSDADQCTDATWQCASGQVTCSDSVTGSSHVETCDGQDNDCSGKADDAAGMQCVRGTAAACTYTNGACSAPGSKSCTSLCTYNTCQASAESACNRKDDNCDGIADEALLQGFPAKGLIAYNDSALDTALAVSPAASVAAGGYMAVFVTMRSPRTYALQGFRINESGALVGSLLSLAVPPVGDALGNPNVVWSGSSWLVTYRRYDFDAQKAHMEALRIHPSTGAVTPLPEIVSGDIQDFGLTGGSLPMAIWEDRQFGLRAASLGASTVVKTLKANTRVGDASTRWTGSPRMVVVEENAKWAVWVSEALYASPSATNATGNLHHLEFDGNLTVTRDDVLHRSTGEVVVSALAFHPDSQRVIGGYQNWGAGAVTLSFARDGTSVQTHDFYAWNIQIDGKDGSWASGTGPDHMQRRDVRDEGFESLFANIGGTWTAWSMVATPDSSTTRFAAVVAMEGAFHFLTYGCK